MTDRQAEKTTRVHVCANCAVAMAASTTSSATTRAGPFAIFEACGDDQEWRAFLTLLCYTGLRVNEAIGLRCDKVHLTEGWAYIGMTKNGDPRTAHLPPVVVAELANLPAGLDRGSARVWPRYNTNDPAFYDKFDATLAAACVPKPDGVAFHIFRHTYGTWQRKYGGLDRQGLVETGVWRTAQAAGRYDHAEVTPAARAADRLPTAKKA